MSIELVIPPNHLILCHAFLLLLSIFPSISIFPNISWLVPSGGQNIRASASASVIPMNIQGWFPLGFTDLISLLSKGLQHHSLKASLLWHPTFFMDQFSYPYMTTGKTIASTMWTFVGKVMSLHFNMLSRSVIAFLPRSKHLMSWLQSPSAVIWEPKKIKSVTVSIVSPSSYQEMMVPDAMILVFWMLSFKSAFSLSSFTFVKRLFSSSSLSAFGWYHLHIWGYWYFSQQSWFQLVIHPAQHFAWYILHTN